jgi:hypothetical protein
MEFDAAALPEILRTPPVLTRPVGPGDLDDQVLAAVERKPPRAWFVALPAPRP